MPGGTWLYSALRILFYERSILSRIRRRSAIRTRFRNVRGSFFFEYVDVLFLSAPCAMRIWNTRRKSFVILGEITCPGYNLYGMDTTSEIIRLYARHLKMPTFAESA